MKTALAAGANGRWTHFPPLLAGLILCVIPVLVTADDFDFDGDTDIDDVDALVGEIINGTNSPDFDLNDDGFVDTADLSVWLLIGAVRNGYAEAFPIGDANLSGTVDNADRDVVLANFGTSPNTWSGGDFNADGVVNVEDSDAVYITWGIVVPTTAPGAITWAPLTLDFGVVTQGGSADQSLTLMNSADDGTLIISNIQFTFNQQGAFSMSPFVPSYLNPGDSTVVELTFAPSDISFFMADLRITSNATNAPVITYSILGMGDTTLVCYPPYADCGGVCALLDSSVNNCGSCGNVCPDPANGSAFCGAGICDFLCDEGYAKYGNGCIEPGPITIEEMYISVYQAAMVAIDLDRLTGKGPPSTDQDHPVVPHRLDAFVNFLDNAAVHGFDVGDYETACAMLNAMQVRSDGLAQPQDFVTGPAAPELNASIRMVIDELDGCELRLVNP